MNARYCVQLLFLMYAVVFSGSIHAEEPLDVLTADQRGDLKRQVMSKPGVFLDMANMTDSGYVWENDVLWEGSVLPTNEKWYTVGFFFKREGYKGVWLQYTFQVDNNSGKLFAFRRSYGTGTFR